MCTLAWPESDAQLDALRFLALEPEVERDSRADSLRFFLVLILLLLPLLLLLLLLLLLVVAVALRVVLGNAAHTLLDQRS